MAAPRVTFGIATYDRDTYLAEAIDSCLAQDYDDFEVLVVVDGPGTPALDAVLDRYAGHPLVRVVRHGVNRHISAAYNTIISEGRGELIAMLGDDDVAMPDRLSRSVAIFDAHPDTGVVHGDAVIIDGQGREAGAWKSADLAPSALLELLVRRHNYLIDPTRMVHRRVYEAVGGYTDGFKLAQDMEFWMRAVPDFRFRHVAGGPITKFRRHGENFSDESQRGLEVAEVERILRESFARIPLRRLVPELDWGVLEPRRAERRAWEVLADAMDRRELPLPSLAAELRERARAVPQPAAPRSNGKRILLTSFGFEDSGGGTTVPRVVAKELVNRGWDVTVFHAATRPDPSGIPYAVREWEADGVRLVGVHNRQHGLWDLGNPLREIDDPAITAAFAQTLDRVKPDVVHVHNLHNLGAALLDQIAARGIPAYFSTHNYWLICPRAYLLTGQNEMCGGPGDHGGDCASCVGSRDVLGHQERLAEIRARMVRNVDAVLAVSGAMKRTLAAQGYPEEMIDVVRQAVPAADEVWERLGRDRRPGRAGEKLTVAFFGSAYPHKGPQLLVEAAQRTDAGLRVLIHGEVPNAFAEQLRRLDRRGVVEIAGAFSPSELPGLLAGVDAAVMPSMWWDCAPLMAAECLAGRVPLLAPRLGGLGEAITDEVDGLFFDALDAADLARQLDRLDAEDGLLERLQSAIEPPRRFSAYVDELEAYYAGARPSRDATPPARLAVQWVGDHTLKSSLSTINREVGDRLGDAVALRRVERNGVAHDAPLPHAADVEVRHAWPPDLTPPRAGRLALIQPWEFGAIPKEWVEPLRANVDELWVPSEYVARMYLDAGLDADRVHVVPNGADVDRLRPDGPRLDLDGPNGLRFLFVGGAVMRKGIDVLLAAYRMAFAGREDVTLIVKDFGANGVYRGADREELRRAHEQRSAPRIVHLTEELSDEDMAALYRSCDVLVHPYRGEGFAMPVLEAMAAGLPVVVTGGGPTDEFCPESAGWRIASERVAMPGGRVDGILMAGTPWMLEPDAGHLVELLRAAAEAGPEERRARGAAGREAALALSWEAIAARYGERLRAVASRPPRLGAPHSAPAPVEWDDAAAVHVLATPAWRADDRLPELLAAWAAAAPAGTDACLHLLADPAVDGRPEALEAYVMGAAAKAGVDLDACADIDISLQPATAARDARLHAAADAYVPLHGACAGHVRLARAAGAPVVEPDARGLAGLFAPRTALAA